MTSERTVTWQTRDGRTAIVTIKIEKSVADKMVNADGDMVNTGKEIVNRISLEMTVNGKFQTRDTSRPVILTGKAYAKHVAAGAYARLGDAYVSKQVYDEIISAIASATAEIEQANKTEAKEVIINTEKAVKSTTANIEKKGYGWCNKCNTYCYGDCTA